jgi:ribonuclease M5
MKKQVIVVEGTHDVQRLKRIFEHTEIISVNGSSIDEKALNLLMKLDESHQIILCLDPDYAGERIRSFLSNKLKNVSHVFFDRQKAISNNGKKIGVEHMSSKDILKAFENIKVIKHENASDITSSFLYEMKLIGQKESKKLRSSLAEKLHLGQVNSKTLLNRLQFFDYKKRDIIEVLSESSS